MFTPQNDLRRTAGLSAARDLRLELRHSARSGRGLVLDVAYVGNVAHHQFSTGHTTSMPSRRIPPGLPPAAPIAVNSAAVTPVLRPDQSTAVPAASYSTNLIRALAGGYRYGQHHDFTALGESNYNALQMQLTGDSAAACSSGPTTPFRRRSPFRTSSGSRIDLTKNVTGTVRTRST